MVLLVCFFVSLAAVLSSETEIILLPLNDTKSLNYNAICDNDEPHVTFIVNSSILSNDIMERRGLTTNVSDTYCCPANVTAEITVPGLPLNNRLVVSIEVICGSNINAKKSFHWFISLRGISSVEDIQWSHDDQLLSWSPPSFYSDDIPRGAITTYNVLVNGISVINTTDTSTELNVSSFTMGFNLSIVTSVDDHQSTKTITIKKNNDRLDNYTINVTEDIFNFTISSDIDYLISASPTISSTLPAYSSFFSSTTFSSISTSSAEQSSETSNSVLTSSRYSETPTGSSGDRILVKVVPSVVVLVVLIVLIAVLIVIRCLIYCRYKNKKVSFSSDKNPPPVLTKHNSVVLEELNKNEDNCTLSERTPGAGGSQRKTKSSPVSNSDDPAAILPNPPLTDPAAILSEKTESQYYSSPVLTSSNHDKDCHIQISPLLTIVPAERGTTSNDNDDDSISQTNSPKLIT